MHRETYRLSPKAYGIDWPRITVYLTAAAAVAFALAVFVG